MIQKILSDAILKGCSDIHISAGYKIMMRLNGDLISYEDNINLNPQNSSLSLSKEDVYKMIFSLINENQREIYLKNRSIDFSIQSLEGSRFRANAYHTILGPAIALRIIPKAVRSLFSISAPESIQDLIKLKKGLIIITGPTGSGKSTTLAAIIEHINNHVARHIITIEDPVEYVFKNNLSVINQCELGLDMNSFNGALKNSLRQDPDIIMIGEMRDIETFRLAISAAETGHLVLTTLHTNSASQTINRIIDLFPHDEKTSVRSALADSIRAIISQRLVKKKDGGRCAAFEILIANPSIRNLIREDKIPQINSIIELSKKSGMMLLKDSIKDLMNNNIISNETGEEELTSHEQ